MTVPGLTRSDQGITRTEPTYALSPYRARGLGEDLGVYTRMAHSDPILAGSIALVAREVSRAEWIVEEPRNPTPEEKRATEIARVLLGIGGPRGLLRGSWARHIAHALRASLTYGFAPFEIVWQTVDHPDLGLLVLPTDLYYIPSASVWGWVWDEGPPYELAGLLQLADQGSGRMALGRQSIEIDSSRLLLYTHQTEPHIQPEGLSALRPAWPWWRAKRDTLLRYQEGEELLFGGMTEISEVPHPITGDRYPDVTEFDLDVYDDMLDEWAAGTLRYFFNPLGLKISQHHPEYEVPSPREMMEYYDLQMALTFNAQLLGTPTTKGASMSQPSAQMLYKALDSMARGAADIFSGLPGVETSGILWRAIAANVPGAMQNPAFRTPKLRPVALQYQSFKDYVDGVTKAQQFRAMQYSVENEELLRRMADLPPLSEDEIDLRRRWSVARLESEIKKAEFAEQDRETEEGTQGPTEPPDQMPVADPDDDGDDEVSEE
jgi:hypothetical protein